MINQGWGRTYDGQTSENRGAKHTVHISLPNADTSHDGFVRRTISAFVLWLKQVHVAAFLRSERTVALPF